ncbi:triple tyrosine motif-containing protein [Bilophila wadsworthia]
MLKGLENSWYTLTDPNNVTFRNLPPGKYQFQVKRACATKHGRTQPPH